MKRANAVLFSLLMIVSSLAGCIGGEEVDTSQYEDQIAELEEMLEVQNQTIAQREATIDGLEDGLSDATQMIQDHAEGIAILENLRDILSTTLNSSNSTIDELEALLNTANNSILTLQSALLVQQNLVAEWIVRAINNDFSNSNLRGADLSYADLAGADLSGADLGNSNLSGADLSGADLGNSNLSGADLGNSNLSGADLTGIDLSNTSLYYVRAMNLQGCPAVLPTNWQCVRNNLVGPYADLRFAVLSDQNLGYADLSNADLSNAYLDNADLSNADLSNADLKHAELWRADLTGADMSDTILRYVGAMNLQGCPTVLPTNWQCVQNNLVGPYADLTNAELEGVNLSYADLSYADLTGAFLEGANLSYADLSHVSLMEADLWRADLIGADLSEVFWWNTMCPDGTNTYNLNPETCENNL